MDAASMIQWASTSEGIRPFYENPESMNHLETFLFDTKDGKSLDCAKKIAASLMDNRTLSKLIGMERMDRLERFFLDLNKRGRRYLYQDETVMMRIWPHMLVRVATIDECHLLFFFLRERVDLLSRCMAKHS